MKRQNVKTSKPPRGAAAQDGKAAKRQTVAGVRRWLLGSRPRPAVPKSKDGELALALALTAEARLDLTAQDNESGESRRPTFEILAYTGGAMQISWRPYPTVVDLSGLEVRQDVPILLDHWHNDIVGQATKVTVSKDTLTLAGVITGAIDIVDQPAWKVVAQAHNGFKWRASVGVEPINVEFVEAGSSAQANGKSFTGPAYIVRKGRLGEVSFVAVDADGKSAAKIAARQRNAEGTVMDFEQWLQGKGFALDELTDEQRISLEAAWKADAATDGDGGRKGQNGKALAGGGSPKRQNDDPIGAPSGDLDTGGPVTASGATSDPDSVEAGIVATRVKLAAEEERVAGVRAACGTEQPKLCAAAIKDGWSVEKTELEVYKAGMPQVGASGGNGGEHAAPALEAALCMSAGIPEARVGEWYGERPMNAALATDLRGAGLHTLLHATIIAGGGHARPGLISNDTIRAAFEANGRIVQGAGGFSTISLSGILSNLANKLLLNAYSAVAAVAGRFCSEVDHGDFKPHTNYRMTGIGQFQAVGPTGELKHIELTEDSYTNQVDTKGAIIALNRQMMINDDLGAFAQIPRIIGRMSAIAKEKAAFTLLLGNTGDFFHTANKNLNTGAGSALGIDSLTKAEQTMADQTDKNSDPVLISPAILLTGTALKVYAQQLFKDLNVNETTTANKPKPVSNPHAGKFEVASSPYVNAQGLAGSSATMWYLFANPADVAAMEIAYLRGKRVPTIESASTDFDTLGMKWRGYFDFGVGFQDPRAAVKNDGV